jgi:chromosome partitioning protein
VHFFIIPNANTADPANVRAVIAVATASQKGGVGKTTVCINLAHSLARRGWNTLIVDTDPQGGIGLSLSRSTRTRRGFYDFLMHGGEARSHILPTRLPELSILPAGSFHEFHRLGGRLDRAPESLRDLLRQLDLLGYDCVLMDTAAGLSATTEVIVRGSDWVLIPQQAEPLAVRSVPLLLETLARFRSEGSAVRVAGILLTMLSPEIDASVKVARELRQLLPGPLLFKQSIPRDPLFLEASGAGLPLALMRKNPPAAALMFDQIAAELEDRIALLAHKEHATSHASLLD